MIADRFCCREQIGTGRWAMHPAEVIALALDTKGETIFPSKDSLNLRPYPIA